MAKASTLITDSQGSFGFLSPFGNHMIGLRADLIGFFNTVKSTAGEFPVLQHQLYRGYVGLEDVEGLEADIACLRNLGVKSGEIFARSLSALTLCIEELRAEAAYFSDNPNMAIRTGSTAIPDEIFLRQLPRDAFFAEGPPLWLRPRLTRTQRS
ncbi:hypothetical protein XM53_01870 [Roseovarius atlanticus]|uniref:Uncharacterized protein n=1 Tax=Roseovarius atlanticus TaxID=1641875 RepID=A0A0T5P024_9RHOB|nr:hypothetical protein [Roseovarius atlanticus]KRS14490.1 hypothetical protein XM53_01870 [Roseovarius atlanticus]